MRATNRPAWANTGDEMRFLCTVVGLAFLSGGIASAADAQHFGAYTVQGGGNVLCKSWLEERAQAHGGSLDEEQWILGYITARDYIANKEDNGKGVDYAFILSGIDPSPSVYSWIDGYCSTKENDSLNIAVNAYIDHLISQATTPADPWQKYAAAPEK